MSVLRNLNRVCKWRSVLAGWQLGTRAKGDPECDAVRDHREATIIHRVEISALTYLLMERGIITQEQLSEAIEREAEFLNQMYEEKFPGFRATDIGMQIDTGVAMQTMKGWKP